MILLLSQKLNTKIKAGILSLTPAGRTVNPCADVEGPPALLPSGSSVNNST